jgi:PAS domain S-box-containing protein
MASDHDQLPRKEFVRSLRSPEWRNARSFVSSPDGSEVGRGRNQVRGTLRPQSLSIRAVLLTLAAVCSSLLHAASAAERAPLIFLGDKDYPPVAYLEEGVAKGMDVDLAKALATPMKREIRVELMDWNLAQERVLKGEADGLLGLSISEERRKLYDFASPTFTREFGLVVRSGKMTIRGVGDLKEKSVGVTAGGLPRMFMERQPGVQLVLIDNYKDGLDRLAAGTIDAIAADLWVAAYTIERSGIRGVTIVGKPFATAQGAIAVKKGNLALVNEINRAINALQSDGVISKIQDDWRPQEMLFASRERIRDVFTRAATVLLVVLFGAMAMWIFTLRRQIHIRKMAESALKQSEERLQLAVRGSADGLWDRNILTNDVFFSDHYRELLGYSADEFPGTFASFESRLHPDDKERVLKMVAAHLEQRLPYDAEYRLRTRSGEYRWFRGRGQAIRDAEGRAVRMAGSVTDITERKQTEERINLLQMITMDVAAARDLPSALEVVLRRVCEKTGWTLGQAWIPNQDGTVLDCCPAWFALGPGFDEFRAFSRNMTFRPGAGLPGRGWSSRQPVWVRDVTLDANFPRAEAAGKGGLKAGLAVPILSGENVSAVLEFFLNEPRSEDERLVKVIAAVAAQIGLFIEGKRAEEALRERETRLQTLADASFEGIAVCEDGVLVDANDQMISMLGYSDRSEMMGKPVVELVAPESRDFVRARIESGRIEPYEHLALRKDGSVFPVEVCGRTIVSSPRHVRVTAVRDITARKEAEESLKTLTERLKLATATAAIAVWDWDLRTNEVVWDDRAFEIYGLPPDSKALITYQLWADRVHPEDLPGQEAALKRTIAEKGHGIREFRIIRPDGSVRHVQAAEAVIADERGAPVRMVGVNVDITERKQAEQALRESEERYRAVVEFSPECIAISVDDRLVFLNPAGVKMMGVQGAEALPKLIGRSVYDFVPASLHELTRERRREVLERGIVAPPLETPLLRLNGTSIAIEALAVPFVYDGRPAILNLIRDITERKRAEAERQQAREEFTQHLIATQEAERQRIAGELHDGLGQNLLLVKNRAQLALAVAGAAPELRQQLEGIQDIASQAIAEVRQISQNLHPYQLDHLGLTRALEAMIDNAAQSTAIAFERKLEVVDEVFCGDAATNFYRIVQESLNNVLKHSQAQRVRVEVERDVRDVRLLIEDDGRGFDMGGRVKPGAAGGFGLKNIAERVRILGGRLKLDSKPGVGTRLEVAIPIRDQE